MSSTPRKKAVKKTAPRPVPAGAKLPTDRLGKTPRVRSTTVPLDDEAVRLLEGAQAELDRARNVLLNDRDRRVAEIITSRRGKPVGADGEQQTVDVGAVRAEVDVAIGEEIAAFEKAVEAAYDHVEATSRTFTFRNIGNTAYQKLLTKHPASDDDHEQVKAEGRGTRALYHAESFAPALVQASCIDPVLDNDDIADIFEGETWNLAEIAQLFQTAYEVQTQRTHVSR